MSYYQKLVESVIKGLRIISKYDEDPYFASEHDVIYCGKYYYSFNKMNEKDKKVLEDLGWAKDETIEMWCKHI